MSQTFKKSNACKSNIRSQIKVNVKRFERFQNSFRNLTAFNTRINMKINLIFCNGGENSPTKQCS